MSNELVLTETVTSDGTIITSDTFDVIRDQHH